MSTAIVQPEKIHLQSIRVLKAHFEVAEKLMDVSTGLSHFDVDLNATPEFNLDEDSIRFRLNIIIDGYNEDKIKIEVSGKYCIDTVFKVDNLDEFVKWDEKKENFSVDENIIATIAGISYSTSRGIVLDRTQGTEFKGVILPVINPYDLLKNQD